MRICAVLLCAALFAGTLTGCGESTSETDKPVNDQSDEYTQPGDDFDNSEGPGSLDESEPTGSGDTLLAGLEEIEIEGWDSGKKIKRILINGIHENILLLHRFNIEFIRWSNIMAAR